MKKCLAYIYPLEDITNKEQCRCLVKFINGDLANKRTEAVLTTRIFKYYFWGLTLEVVELDDKYNIVNVYDINMEYVQDSKFSINMLYALSFENNTKKVLGSDGFVYALTQTRFYKNNITICENMFNEILTSNNFAMHMYTLDGGIIYFSFEKNLTEKDKLYKRAIHKGFITTNDKLLRNIGPTADTKSGNEDKLKQSEIDQIIEDLKKD